MIFRHLRNHINAGFHDLEKYFGTQERFSEGGKYRVGVMTSIETNHWYHSSILLP